MSQVAQKQFQPSPNCLHGASGGCVTPIPWHCREDGAEHDWRGKRRLRCACAACHPPSLVEALPLVLVVLAGVLEQRAMGLLATLPALQAVAKLVFAAKPRVLGTRGFSGWQSLRLAWLELHQAVVHASELDDGEPTSSTAEAYLRARLRGQSRLALQVAVLASREELVPPCGHPEARPVPAEELEQYLRGLPEEGRHEVRGEDWHRVRHGWLVLSELLSDTGESALEAAVRGSTRAIVRTAGAFYPYVVNPSLEGAAFGDREKAHRFESFAAAGEWVDRNGGILMTYSVEPAPEDVSWRFTGQLPTENNGRETDPAPPSTELLAERAEGGRALQRLERADQTEAEIGAAHAAAGAQCA